MISLQGVSKRWGGRVAVHPLSLDVPRGVICGLLGHNGAGKSTIIGMILGQVLPDEGRVLIDHCDVIADRGHALARVGAIFEPPSFYEYLSGSRNLQILCEYSGLLDRQRLEQVVRLVRLEDRIGDRVATYSHGMRQRLALAQALLPNPEVLILDEPSQGLDPEGIFEMRDLILKLNREWGLTILFSSHLLSEVQQMCSHLVVLRQGRLLFAGEWRPWDSCPQEVRIRVDRQSEAEAALLQAGLVADFRWDGRARLTPGASVAAIAQWLSDRGFQLQAVAPVERTLEEFYLETIRQPEATHR